MIKVQYENLAKYQATNRKDQMKKEKLKNILNFNLEIMKIW